ncbi:MAG: cytochrome c [Gammaproteobacteria bacterium]|nr:cytochrome c [Gammaproteobacteria bacterium]NCF80931.1 cytochrome c [Pseudomonadota bacterium]
MPSRVWLVLAATLIPFVAGAELATQRQEQLRHLLRHDCGSCHGMRLTGGLGPPLTPSSLAQKPTPALAATIRHGRPGTPMPPWSRFVSEEEARWLVDLMKRGTGDASTND